MNTQLELFMHGPLTMKILFFSLKPPAAVKTNWRQSGYFLAPHWDSTESLFIYCEVTSSIVKRCRWKYRLYKLRQLEIIKSILYYTPTFLRERILFETWHCYHEPYVVLLVWSLVSDLEFWKVFNECYISVCQINS